VLLASVDVIHAATDCATCLILVLGTTQIAQFDKLKGTIEEYADREAEEVKSRYVAKLALEREATLRLKGENGIMKKKFSTLNKQASHSCCI
jgi:hypothetical protein